MHLTDGHIAWMHAFGVTSLRLDAEGNILEVHVDISRNYPKIEPAAPVPPPVPEPTDEEIRKAALKRRKQIAAEAAADRAIAYAEATGLPLREDETE